MLKEPKRRFSLPRPDAHLCLVARAERHLAARANRTGGWKSYAMVLRYAHLAPEKLSSFARRSSGNPLGLGHAADRKRSSRRYVFTTIGAWRSASGD